MDIPTLPRPVLKAAIILLAFIAWITISVCLILYLHGRTSAPPAHTHPASSQIGKLGLSDRGGSLFTSENSKHYAVFPFQDKLIPASQTETDHEFMMPNQIMFGIGGYITMSFNIIIIIRQTAAKEYMAVLCRTILNKVAFPNWEEVSDWEIFSRWDKSSCCFRGRETR